MVQTAYLLPMRFPAKADSKLQRWKNRAVQNIKIPDVCDHFEIDCVTTHEMLQREQAPFII